MGLAWGDAVVEWGCKDGVWDKIFGFQRGLGWWDDVGMTIIEFRV